MRKIYLLFYLFLCTIDVGVVHAFDDVYGGNVIASFDFIVGAGAVFHPDALYVSNSISILNNGVFETDVYLCDGCDLYIRNQGDFTAYMNGAGRVYHVVSGVDDLNVIDVNKEYLLLVQGAEHLVLNDVYDVAGAADKIIIQDSVIDFGVLDINKSYELELHGNVVFYQGGIINVLDGPLIHNVSGDANITFVTNVINPLFVNVAYIDNEALYVRQVRETDYVKVLGAGIGDYLNNIRIMDSGDRLLGALDSAVDMSSLYDVMTDSVRLNPDKLLETVRIISSFDGFSSGVQSGVGVRTALSITDDFDSYELASVAGITVGDFGLGVWVRYGELYYLSDVDEFKGGYYGVSLNAEYLVNDNMFVRGAFGLNNFEFDVGNVFYDGRCVADPSVLSGSLLADYGVNYQFYDRINVTPFVGLDMKFYRLENIYDLDFGLRTGVGAGYTYQMHAIRYDYDLNIVFNSLGESGIQLDAGFWSVYDNAGGNISLSIMRVMDVMAYKTTIGGKIVF